ncbi:MAG: (d)CMP kinase [Candidatus Eremiobacteraeota bacterium]|nr:(d)CMP kinase [Candidatus Eremiobacteraeota bacterium]MCW5871756.1 (d)CMP kinase [Candidatus Eremiobacteraeota bacterium]
MKKANVAIDGFAGSGKTTVAVELARQLELVYLDTGLMYRSVALQCLREGLDAGQDAVLASLMERFELKMEVVARPHPTCRMILGREDVTDELHDPRVTALVPQVASCSAVRRELVARQQAFARRGGVVMVGRDIASVVLPDAEVKIFLAANLAERARRRSLELAAKGRHLTQQEVEADLALRDKIDSEREDSPLICVAEARQIDTTGRTVAEVVDEISGWVRCGSV